MRDLPVLECRRMLEPHQVLTPQVMPSGLIYYVDRQGQVVMTERTIAVLVPEEDPDKEIDLPDGTSLVEKYRVADELASPFIREGKVTGEGNAWISCLYMLVLIAASDRGYSASDAAVIAELSIMWYQKKSSVMQGVLR
jgi:hypothetical protein